MNQNLNQDQKVDLDSSKPLAYQLGRVSFYGLDLLVDERVLIPRMESELLVERALFKIKNGLVLDLCAGSGCLGLAIQKERQGCRVVLSDISVDALSLIRENAAANGLDVEVVQGDLLESVSDRVFDYVICNPPYISEADYEGLQSSVKDYEPKIALVGGKTGLEFYEKLALQLPKHIQPKGWAFFEIGYDQGSQMGEIFSSDDWVCGQVNKDYAGHDRFFSVQRA